jgi:putative intracellular protease/amidase
MKITIFLFDGFTALDVTGPYEVLVRMPGAEIFLQDSKQKLILIPML